MEKPNPPGWDPRWGALATYNAETTEERNARLAAEEEAERIEARAAIEALDIPTMVPLKEIMLLAFDIVAEADNDHDDEYYETARDHVRDGIEALIDRLMAREKARVEFDMSLYEKEAT